MSRVSYLLMTCAVVACSSPSQVVIAEDPASGTSTAYATLFLQGTTTRLVLSAPVRQAQTVNLTIWAPADHGACAEMSVVVGDHVVRAEQVEARTVGTPSGADQTTSFALPPAVIRQMATSPSAIQRCDLRLELDDEDRDVLSEFVDELPR